MAFAYSAHSAVLPPNADAIEKEVGSVDEGLTAEDLQRNKRWDRISKVVKSDGSKTDCILGPMDIYSDGDRTGIKKSILGFKRPV